MTSYKGKLTKDTIRPVVFPSSLSSYRNMTNGDMHGPAPGRRHDSFFLRKSEIGSNLASLQQGMASQGQAYRNAAYTIISHDDRGFRGADMNASEKTYNKDLSRARIGVEWQLGQAAIRR